MSRSIFDFSIVIFCVEFMTPHCQEIIIKFLSVKKLTGFLKFKNLKFLFLCYLDSDVSNSKVVRDQYCPW